VREFMGMSKRMDGMGPSGMTPSDEPVHHQGRVTEGKETIHTPLL
jgi:hypothetical protein